MSSLQQNPWTDRDRIGALIRNIALDRTGASTLPNEIAEQITDYARPKTLKVVHDAITNQPLKNVLAATPPASGACLFMAIPAETRRKIFAVSLPDRKTECHPKCEDSKVGDQTSKKKAFLPTRGPLTTLMVLNKKICAEISEVLYQERWFVVHVHEGLLKGGIEFLQAGRQPLQFQDTVYDQRFSRFIKGDQFGFERLKKIRIQIYPTVEEHGRHTTINTYLVIMALCRLLQRSSEKEKRITNLIIEFMKPKGAQGRSGRGAIQRAEQYWYDPDKQKPRESSIHTISNIELVLLPFANLTGCHNVDVELPANVRGSMHLSNFVANLKKSMKSVNGTMKPNDELDMNIEKAKDALEDYVEYVIPNKAKKPMEKLKDTEVQEGAESDSDEADDEVTGRRKHDLSPNNSGTGNKHGKRRTDKWSGLAMTDEEVAFAFDLKGDDGETRRPFPNTRSRSKMSAWQLEQRQVEEAIAGSLGQSLSQTISNTFDSNGSDSRVSSPAFETMFEASQHRTLQTPNRDQGRALSSRRVQGFAPPTSHLYSPNLQTTNQPAAYGSAMPGYDRFEGRRSSIDQTLPQNRPSGAPQQPTDTGVQSYESDSVSYYSNNRFGCLPSREDLDGRYHRSARTAPARSGPSGGVEVIDLISDDEEEDKKEDESRVSSL